MAFLSLVWHRACAETKDTFLVTKRINLIKQFITLHYITLLALVWFAWCLWQFFQSWFFAPANDWSWRSSFYRLSTCPWVTWLCCSQCHAVWLSCPIDWCLDLRGPVVSQAWCLGPCTGTLANGTRCLFWAKPFARPIDHLSVVSTNHVSTCVWFEASYLYSNHRPNNCFPFLVTACLPFRFKAVFACCVTLLLTDVDGEPPCLSGNNLW